MPRPTNLSAAGVAKAQRQAKYRMRLLQSREPEADRVDTAIAQACVALLAHVDAERIETLKPALKALIRGVLDILGGVDEFEPVSCGSNMNHADEALGELVVSSSNGAVDFQSAKHPFD